MKDDKLPQIDHTLTSVNPQINESQCFQGSSSIYRQAIRDLKLVHKKIASIKTRMNQMTLRNNNQKNRTLFFDRQATLRMTIYKEENDKVINERMRLERVKASSQAQLKKVYIQNKKHQIIRKINKAQKNTSQAKFRSHDKAKQISLENLRKIKQQKRKDFQQRQQKHDNLYENEKKHRDIMRNLKNNRQRQAKQYCSLQTKLIYTRIQERQKQLAKVERQCEKYEMKLKHATNKKNKKIKLIQNLRQNLSPFPNINCQKHENSSISPQSSIRFATIQ